MVVAVWEAWDAAVATADQEASELAEVFWVADRMPEPEGRQIQELVRSYASVVMIEEWPLRQKGKTSPKAWDLLDELRAELHNFEPSTPAQQILYEQGLERMHELADARRDRLLEAEQGLPVILWIVLVVGGIVVVGFTYPFGLDSTLIHLLVVAALALIVFLVLFTVATLDFPFRGRRDDRPRRHGTGPRQVRKQQAQRSLTGVSF
jgi:hypothetical protein